MKLIFKFHMQVTHYLNSHNTFSSGKLTRDRSIPKFFICRSAYIKIGEVVVLGPNYRWKHFFFARNRAGIDSIVRLCLICVTYIIYNSLSFNKMNNKINLIIINLNKII